MKIVADLHTHTCASAHAYSTLLENCAEAEKKGHIAIAVTDHGPSMPDSPYVWHFGGMAMLPKRVKGVYLLKGAEVNVLNVSGEIDLPERYLKDLDFCIASLHGPVFEYPGFEKQTETLLNILKNKYVDALGHPGNPAFEFDYEYIISRCNEYGKLVEINNNTFVSRQGSTENCKKIASLCKKYNVPVIVNSDAHFSLNVGFVDKAFELLESVDFPERLVLNSDASRLNDYFKIKKGIDLISD